VARNWRLIRAQRGYGGCFLLNTMRKSGSHYLMSILANYLWLELLGSPERLDYPAMKAEIWNQRRTGPALERLRELTGYAAWIWEHENYVIRYNNARTIVHTYRNPLDTIVSRYFYLYANRADRSRDVGLSEAIELETPAFAWHYAAVRAIGRRPNVLRVAYEQLVRDPAATGAEVLERSGLPVATDGLERAVSASSRKQVSEDEARHGLEEGNLVGDGMTASFIRSGEIGEWKRLFGTEQVRRIEEILADYRIGLDEFTLE
jgi:hypothetical protein